MPEIDWGNLPDKSETSVGILPEVDLSGLPDEKEPVSILPISMQILGPPEAEEGVVTGITGFPVEVGGEKIKSTPTLRGAPDISFLQKTWEAILDKFKDPEKESAAAVLALVDSENLGISPDAAYRLKSQIDGGMTTFPKANMKRTTAWGRVNKRWERGMALNEANNAYGNWLKTNDDKWLDVGDKVAVPSEEDVPVAELGIVEDAVGSAAELMPMMIQSTQEAGWKGVTLGSGFAAIAALAGQPELIPVAAQSGLTVGMTWGAMDTAMMIEGGAAVRELRQIKDKDGKPLDRTLVRGAAWGIGTLNSIFEVAGLKALVKTIPGGDKIFKEATYKTIKSKALKDRILYLAREFGAVEATEVGVELAQESTNIVMEELAKYVSESVEGTDFETDAMEIVNRLRETGVEAAKGFAVLTLPGLTVKTITATPESISSFESVLSEDTRATYEAEKARAMAKGQDEAQATESALKSVMESPEVQTHIDEIKKKAAKEGIPTAEQVMERITTEELTDEQLTEMLDIFAEGQEIIAEDVDAVSEIKNRLIDIGMPEEEASSNAALYSGFDVLAKRAGVPLDDLITRYLPEISKRDMIPEVTDEDRRIVADNPVLNNVITDEAQLESFDELRGIRNDLETELEANRDTWSEEQITQQEEAISYLNTKVTEEQLIGGIPRGRIRFYSDRVNIDLLKDADQSTFVHETGHLYLMMMNDLANVETASQELKDDFEIIKDWLGVEDGEITRDQNEQFARGFEAYLREGKAPTPALKRAFENFKKWLMEIYRSLSDLDVELTDDVRGAMDRMFIDEGMEAPVRGEVSAAERVVEFEQRAIIEYDIRKIVSGEYGVFERESGDFIDAFKTRSEAEEFIPTIKAKKPKKPTFKPKKKGNIVIYRGEYSGNLGGNFYHEDVEFARQFTQSGQYSEIVQANIQAENIYAAKELPYGGDLDQIESTIENAKRKGYKAIYTDEGIAEKPSIFVFNNEAVTDQKRGVEPSIFEQPPTKTTFKEETEPTFSPREVTSNPVPADILENPAKAVRNYLPSHAEKGQYFYMTANDLQAHLDKHGDGFLYRVGDRRSVEGGFERGKQGYLHKFATENKKTLALNTSLEGAKKYLASSLSPEYNIIYRIMPQDLADDFIIHIPSNEAARNEGDLIIHSPKPASTSMARVLYSQGNFTEENTDVSRRAIEQRRAAKVEEGAERAAGVRVRPGVAEGRAEAGRITEELEQAPKKKPSKRQKPVKTVIREVTGQKKAPELKQLREDFLYAARAAKQAFKEGKDLGSVKEARKLKNILARARKIRIVRDYFNLSDADLKKISRKNPLLMSQYEFKLYLDDVRVKAVQLTEETLQKAMLINLIHEKDLNRVDNYRRALGFPVISKMTVAQVQSFADLLETFHDGDTFLSERELETVDRTDLKGIATWREARERLAKEVGVSVEELSKIKVKEWDEYKWDTALAEANPFYKMLVTETTRKLLEADMRTHDIENEVFELAKKSEKSRGRTLVEKAIPQDKQIMEYLETPVNERDALIAEMTPEQVDLAHYMESYFASALEYLIQTKALARGRENYFVHMRRTFLENVKEEGLLGAFRDLFKTYQEDEATFNILDDDTGNILPLEKFFQFALRRTGGLKPTANVIRGFLVYAQMLEKKRSLDELIPKMDIYAQSLTPEIYTPRGLEIDRSIKQFVNKYINNKKGRRIRWIAKQGGTIDVSIRGLRTFTTLMDLGLNIPTGIAAFVGEQVANFEMLGTKGYTKGTARIKTAKGKAILDKYEAFVGRSAWEEFRAPGKQLTERISDGLFGLFHEASVLANKQFLLGVLTEQEYNSGEISTERLAEIKIEMGRFRVVPGTKSLVGSTSAGSAMMQYKTWAAPIIRTLSKNAVTLTKDLSNKPAGEALTTKEAREIYRFVALSTTAVIVGAMAASDDDDESFTGQLLKRIYRESMTLLQGVDPTLWLATPRIMGFLTQLGKNLKAIATLEEYKTKPGLKGVDGLQRQLTPRAIKQVLPEKKKTEKL